MNPVSVAIKGKGTFNFIRRGTSIARRYGVTPGKMDRALAQFAAVLRQFECSATFPITTVALQRNPRLVGKYQAQGIEFAIHGYRHVDHSQLSPQEQSTHLASAQRIFAQAGIRAQGFRSPYLRWNSDTLAALQQGGLVYDSSQGLAWDVLNGSETPAYRHVLDFYGALSANDFPSLPSLQDDLVRIPYNLPDDEALVERLALASPEAGSEIWTSMLRRTYELGELFSLGLHPERIAPCHKPLTDTLAAARRLSPPVWIARLDEIAAWWRARSEATVQVTTGDDREFQVTVDGPPGVVALARGVHVQAATRPWISDYQQVETLSFTLRTERRPFIGVAPDSSDRLMRFLRQQGYIVETATDAGRYALYLDQTDLAEQDERGLLTQIEKADLPLVKLGRWPEGNRSALTISGDLDALTLWDYGLRFLGR
jgi:hypothetical protein